MEYINQVLLVGYIKRVYKQQMYTTDFVLSVKRKDKDIWDDILLSCNNLKTNGWLREKSLVSIAGVLRTDSWPIGKDGKAVKEPKKVDNRFKDENGKYYDEKIVGWKSKTFVVVVNAELLPHNTESK